MAVHGASHSSSLSPSARLLLSPAPCSGQACPQSGAAAPGNQNDSIPGGRREKRENREGGRGEEGGEENKMEGRKEDYFCSKMTLVEEGGT